MIYDTNFLIALQGRKKGFSASKARQWSLENDKTGLYIARIVEIEFLAGFAADSEATPYLEGFTVLAINQAVLTETLRVMRDLRQTGKGIGAADSMIAATARLYGLPLVTDNARHFARVPGLDVRSFMG